uniref:Uncharacterized protein n=1 Tax=Ditylenchus dipsaci TaxID=166011 RepID=A0A915DRW8_9BILA
MSICLEGIFVNLLLLWRPRISDVARRSIVLSFCLCDGVVAFLLWEQFGSRGAQVSLEPSSSGILGCCWLGCVDEQVDQHIGVVGDCEAGLQAVVGCDLCRSSVISAQVSAEGSS